MKRRTFLASGLSGAGLLVLSACTSPQPVPTSSGTPTKSALPQPTAFARTSWTKDPFSRGSQSYLATGSSPQSRVELATPVADRVFFAGEATSSTRPGSVTGAQLSGLRVAQDVASQAADGERIAIVGAGIAGATAARQLTAAGFDVVVLEARDRVGGRIDTLSGDAWPFPVERGATFVDDVAGSPVIGQLAALKVKTKLFTGEMEIRSPTGAVVKPSDVAAKAVRDAVKWAEAQSADVSLTAALTKSGGLVQSTVPDKNGISDADRLENYLDSEIEIETGALPDTLSAQFGVPPADTGAQRVVLGGYDTVVHSALSNIDVRLSAVVTTVSYANDVVAIRFASGESLQADRIVVTAPLGVLKSDAITFDPELPGAISNAIAAIGMGANEKVILRFDQPFWQTDAQVWSTAGSDYTITNWINLEPVTNEAVLIGQVAAEDARAFAKLGDDEVEKEAMTSLAPFIKK